MKKVFLVLLPFLFLVCSSDATDELTIAVPFGKEGELLIEQLDQFCHEKNIKNITYTKLPISLNEFDDEFINSYLKTSICADVIPIKNCWTAPLTGMLEILDTYQLDYELDMHLDSYVRNNYYYDNTLYSKLVALPYSADPVVLYINKALSEKYGFDKAISFDQLEKQCLEVIQKEKNIGNSVEGFVFCYKPNGKLFETVCDMLRLSDGGAVVNESYQSSIGNSAAQNLFTSISRWIGTITPEIEENGKINILDMIGKNEALYVFAPASFSLSDNKNFFAKYRFSAFGYEGGSKLTARGYSYGIKRGCQRMNDALKIIRFISSTKQQMLRYNKGLAFPTYKEFYAAYEQNNKFLEGILSDIYMSESCLSKDLVSNYFYVKELFIDAIMPCITNGQCTDVSNSFEYELLHLYNKAF